MVQYDEFDLHTNGHTGAVEHPIHLLLFDIEITCTDKSYPT